MMSSPTPKQFRPDIQGLRAVAVLLVLVFHIWPAWVPGGYVGVDVFFVISGFLITQILVKEAAEQGRINIANFYARRVRRLLPAATLVLTVTGLASLYFLPSLNWPDTARHLAASALYVENINLFLQSTNYLSADTPPGPFQHYWSLSVEEQFYFVAPLLIIIVATITLRSAFRFAISTIFFLIFATSLAYSVIVTLNDPAAAYFQTFTRIWELALGGFIAQIMRGWSAPAPIRILLGWIGLIAIGASSLLYSEATPFPGYAALAPTLGAACLLFSGTTPTTFGADRILSLRPMQFFGDISYSLYLWHWPIIIFATVWRDSELGILVGGIVALLSIAIATASKFLIEDRFRHPRQGAAPSRSLMSGIGLIAAALLVSATLLTPSLLRPPAAPVALDDPNYPGAMSLLSTNADTTPQEAPFRPELQFARGDNPDLYADECHVSSTDDAPTPCIYPPLDGKPSERTIILTGDSHAAHWLPALQALAASRNWTIISHTKSSCAFIDAPLLVAGAPYPTCTAWNHAVMQDIIARKPDLVVTSMITNTFPEGAESSEQKTQLLSEGLARAWDTLGEAGIPVLAIKGTPRFDEDVPNCVATHSEAPNDCAITRDVALKAEDSIPAGVEKSQFATLADMADGLCTATICNVVVGNILVYRDQHHITKTYSRTLATLLANKIDSVLN